MSFTVHRGEAVGVVGESGSGKSLTALAVTRLIEEPGRVDAERLRFLGADLLTGTVRAHRHLLGTSLGMVFQDPTSSFNPTQRIGPQLAEAARHHHGMTRRQASARAVDMLRAVRVPAAERRARQYPHEFSGGMRQRAMIGMGLTGRPALIVADEPTTALDVTVQRQVLELLQSVRAAQDTAIVFISHDITVVSQLCDRIMVMYAYRIVEDLPAAELTTAARHPYTRALVAAVPDMHTDLNRPLMVIPGRPVLPTDVPQGCAFAPRCPLADAHCTEADPPLDTDEAGRMGGLLARRGTDPERERRRATRPSARRQHGRRPGMSELRFEDVTIRYGQARRGVTAVDRVSLTIPDSQVVGLVGESGSGKSTLARGAVGLTPLHSGRILLDGRPVHHRGGGRRPVQMIFQDPYSSLDPRMTVGATIAETVPRRRPGGQPVDRCRETARLLDMVGLEAARAHDYPAQLSGGSVSEWPWLARWALPPRS